MTVTSDGVSDIVICTVYLGSVNWYRWFYTFYYFSNTVLFPPFVTTPWIMCYKVCLCIIGCLLTCFVLLQVRAMPSDTAVFSEFCQNVS